MKRHRKAETKAEKQARQQFTESVLARGACEILPYIEHECDGPADACHLIPKRFLKDHCHSWSEQGQLAFIWDTRNALAACRVGHTKMDNALNPFSWRLLPPAAIEFAGFYGITWRLAMEFPDGEAA